MKYHPEAQERWFEVESESAKGKKSSETTVNGKAEFKVFG